MTDTALADRLREIRDWPVGKAAAAVIHGGDITTEVHNCSETDTFALASVSKLVTAYALLIAVEEGAFELDDRVDADLVEALEGNAPPTIRDLLAHASGVGFKEHAQEKPAHTRRIYSSAGYEILAEYLERATEIPFATYVAQAICEPLGISILVEGSAGHGFSSNLRSMTVLAGEFLTPTLLSERTLSEALAVHYDKLAGVVPGYGRQIPCPWGLGFELHGQKSPHWLSADMPADVAGHFGQSGTFLWVHRPTNRAAVVLSDTAFGDWAKQRWDGFNRGIWAATASGSS
ncbi:serine hydrolase domain-containing protein [Corynebacterium auriscanis]|uniref:serine hydrolase domain-containing protein n=1 Tax=Corynebacterium auriscanis TaxID=99807 RepID=UPI0024ADE24C|nr:serine hydrolase domain-containing protein [Corynebacterium auriscanis]